MLFCIIGVREDDPVIAKSFVDYMMGNLGIPDKSTVDLFPVPGSGGKWFFEADDLIVVRKERLSLFNPEKDTVFATAEVSRAILNFFEKYGRSVAY